MTTEQDMERGTMTAPDISPLLERLKHCSLGNSSFPWVEFNRSECAALYSVLTAGERLRELALIWSAYQDDDSKRDQLTDPHLRAQAETAARNLLEALL